MVGVAPVSRASDLLHAVQPGCGSLNEPVSLGTSGSTRSTASTLIGPYT